MMVKLDDQDELGVIKCSPEMHRMHAEETRAVPVISYFRGPDRGRNTPGVRRWIMGVDVRSVVQLP